MYLGDLMRRSSLLSLLWLVLLLGCCQLSTAQATCTLNPTNNTVTICTPANGSAVGTTFHINAGVTDKNPITYMQVYVSYQLYVTQKRNFIDATITVPAGKSQILTVQAKDSTGVFIKQHYTINVSAATPVSIAPLSPTVQEGNTQPFTANVPVTWAASCGSISASGVFTAPLSAGSCNVTATATDGSGANAATTATISSPVSISPPSATTAEGLQQQFTANMAVNWTASCGLINTTGVFTAPAATGKCTVTATASSGTAYTATAIDTVTAAVAVTVNPGSATIAPSHTEQFSAVVTGTSNPGVIWAVDGTAGGNTTVGTVDNTGFYTAPSTIGPHTVSATSAADPSKSGSATVNVTSGPTPGVVPMITYHNDAARTGSNPNETILNPGNVNQTTFGKKYSFPVDAQIYAQPLYMPNLTIGGVSHNVVFVATENNSVYAFDADGASSTPLWQVSIGKAIKLNDVEGLAPLIGITSTPAIDPVTGTIYVVTKGLEGTVKHFRLHALDVKTGTEKFGGPVIITGTVAGTGLDSVSGSITLETKCYQRTSLAMDSTNVYIAFGHCAHGWVFAYNKSTLAQTGILNVTPNGGGGGFWNGGGAPVLDASGNIFMLSGVDTGDPAFGYPDSFLRISSGLAILDFFTPSNEATLSAKDADLGSGSLVLMPDNSSTHPHEILGGGKDGRIFVVDRDDLGGFNTTADHVVQTVPTGIHTGDNIFSTPGYWNGNLYIHSQNDVLKAYSWSSTTGLLSTTPTSKASTVFGIHGATVSISSNGTSSGIVWEIESTNQPTSGPAILHAYDATNVATELYNSSQAGTRDTAGPAVKFVVPTVTDGKVFVGTGTELDVYGLLN
jgi:hypothetical protein